MEAIRERVAGVVAVAGSLSSNAPADLRQHELDHVGDRGEPDYFDRARLAGRRRAASSRARRSRSAAKVAVLGSTVVARAVRRRRSGRRSIRIAGVPFEVDRRAADARARSASAAIRTTSCSFRCRPRERGSRASRTVPNQVGPITSRSPTRRELAGAEARHRSDLLRQRRRSAPGEQDDFRVRNLAEIAAGAHARRSDADSAARPPPPRSRCSSAASAS